jgi:hypothetical protein
MRRLAWLAIAVLLLAQGSALAQRQERSQAERRPSQAQPRDRRQSLSRERSAPSDRQREQRFTPAEREKLRQDVMDANREIRGKEKR